MLAWRRRLAILLGVIGPGIIAANADNDAGGITTYSIVGAHYGFQMLWVLLLITVSLAVTQEIGARLGAITGKGLAALIRENYGVRITFFAMLVLLIANLGTTISEFAGVAASLELFGVPRAIGVLLAAGAAWALVIRGSYKVVERVLLALSFLYLSYVLAAVIARPDWGEVARSLVTPTLKLESDYLLMLIALVGTTITPWGQFFIQDYVVDKGVTWAEFRFTRLEVYAGAVLTDAISLFIIVTGAATLFVAGIRIQDASGAALALEPLAGPLAEQLFALGLLNASLLGSAVLPLSTAYPICEAFGWEAGLNKSFREAPYFNALVTLAIAGGAAVLLLPGLPLVPVMLAAQTLNGILLPVILFLAIRLASKPGIMGEHASGPVRNAVAWATAGGLTAATVALVGTSMVLPALGISF